MSRQPAGLAPGEPTSGRRRRILFAVAGTLIGILAALLLAEIVLRIAGFVYELRAIVVERAANTPEVPRAYLVDDDLMWVAKSYDDRLRWAKERTVHIALMGDSCTEWGQYDRPLTILFRQLGRPLTVINLGNAAWSTHQGLAQLRRDVPPLRPKVVTIYYGWNDHWVSIGLTDAEIQRLVNLPLVPTRKTRVGQLVLRGLVALRRNRTDPPFRVPPEAFRNNLVQMAREVRALEAVPVFITAPTSHEVGHEPAYLAEAWMPDLKRLVPTHQKYVSLVREVASAEQVLLCDATAHVAALPAEDRKGYFMEDGIHFTPSGSMQFAAFLIECLDGAGLLDSPGIEAR